MNPVSTHDALYSVPGADSLYCTTPATVYPVDSVGIEGAQHHDNFTFLVNGKVVPVLSPIHARVFNSSQTQKSARTISIDQTSPHCTQG